jgi:hypothetical protein
MGERWSFRHTYNSTDTFHGDLDCSDMHVLHTSNGKMELEKLTGDKFISVLLMLASLRHVETAPTVSDVRRNGI